MGDYRKRAAVVFVMSQAAGFGPKRKELKLRPKKSSARQKGGLPTPTILHLLGKLKFEPPPS